MKKYKTRAFRAVLVAAVAILCTGGCSSQSDDVVDTTPVSAGVDDADQNLADDERLDTRVTDGGSTDSVGVQTGNPQADSAEPDDDLPDVAEYFFTEADRQWFCSVTTPVSVFTDQFYAERFGSAWFERFGFVEWRSHDELDQLEIETISGEAFSLREIFASNTILEFQRHNAESTESDLYECVLTTRDTGSL